MGYTGQEIGEITKLESRIVRASPPPVIEWRERYLSRTEGLRLDNDNLSSFDKLAREVLGRRAVCVGDFHTFGGAKTLLVRLMEAKPEGKRLALGTEQFDLEHQPYIDLFLDRYFSVDDLLDMARYEERWGCDRKPMKRVLLTARRKGVEVIALNDPSIHYNDLAGRENCAAGIASEILNQDPELTMLVSYGDFHVCLPHLKGEIDRMLTQERRQNNRTLTIRQNDKNIYWQIRGTGRLPAVVRLREDTFSFHNAHPLRVLNSYFDSVGYDF